MTFSSVPFFIFFAIVCGVMAITNLPPFQGNLRLRQAILLIASYVFYGWWNWKCCFLMLGLTAIAYACARAMEGRWRRLALAVGVAVPLVILGIFKYFNFFIEAFCAVFSIKNVGALNILLPVGISFYTFQSLSYIIDVYKGKLAAESSFLRVALYIAFFPQLVAGPIVKAGEFLPQLHQDRNISLKNLETGIQIFLFGLFKKIVLSDHISVFVDAVYRCPNAYHAYTLLLAVFAYSVQIYYDFSGYSDMAVGCARCLGYDLPRNFNLPYISRNISEFWKRWHISLSSWLQEYLYIPLGGNRKGTLRTYCNLFLTMVLGGLWHGASWTFVVWGGLHGVALCVHKLFLRARKGRRPADSQVGAAVSVAATFLFVSFCWIFFRAPDFTTAWSMLTGILLWKNGVVHTSCWAVAGILIALVATAVAVVRSGKRHEPVTGFYPTMSLDTTLGLLVLFLTIGLILGLAYTGDNPFIYFQF